MLEQHQTEEDDKMEGGRDGRKKRRGVQDGRKRRRSGADMG